MQDFRLGNETINPSASRPDILKNLTLTRFVVFFLGCLLLFLNQRWLFLHDPSCHYRTVFLWHYLEHLPELLAYALSLSVNLVAAYLIVQTTVSKPVSVKKQKKWFFHKVTGACGGSLIIPLGNISNSKYLG